MSLSTILDRMYQDSLMRDKIPQRRKLPNNLHLTLTNSSSEGLTLEISRDKVYPAAKEFETCLKHFPYFTGKKIIPVQCIGLDGRMALRAKLPNRREVAEQMPLE
jgi:hypothetical protein